MNIKMEAYYGTLHADFVLFLPCNPTVMGIKAGRDHKNAQILECVFYSAVMKKTYAPGLMNNFSA
jgi:hypothetical protein